MNVLALIPARGGSAKNRRVLGGHPLVAWAIAAGQAAGFPRVVVSSDDPEILALARDYGAEPLARPAELATASARDGGVLRHARTALTWTDPIAYLRPTTPLRDPLRLQAAVRLFLATPLASALRAVHAAPESPMKWYRGEGDWLQPLDPRAVDAPRQELPAVWVPNGAIDLVRRVGWGERVLGFAMPGLEFDTPAQFAYIEFVQSRSPSPLLGVLDARHEPHGVGVERHQALGVVG